MKSSAGMTLIELVVGLAFAATAVGFVLPSFNKMVERQRVAAVHNLLHSVLNQARTVAITARKSTVVCPSDDGLVCRLDGKWEGGWFSFVDANANGRKDVGEMIIASRSEEVDQLLLRSSSSRPSARFMPSGRSAGSNMSIRLCSPSGRALQAVIINNGGRTRRSEASENSALAPCATV